MIKKTEINILFLMLIEAISLLFFFKENIINTILGMLLGIILILITKNIQHNNITKKLLLITSILLSLLSFYQIINFVSDNLLKNYSKFIIILPFIIISIYLLLKEYHTFIKAVEISFYFYLFIKCISFLLIIPKININNFPLNFHLSIDYHFIFLGLFILYLYKTINYLTGYQIKKKETIISLLNPLFMKLLTILVLGNTLFTIYNYPYINYLKTIRYFDFIERIDGIISFEYLFCFFYLFVFLLFNCKLLYQKSKN